MSQRSYFYASFTSMYIYCTLYKVSCIAGKPEINRYSHHLTFLNSLPGVGYYGCGDEKSTTQAKGYLMLGTPRGQSDQRQVVLFGF